MASRKQERGVTLIELMVVVVIISILASIAVPSYRSYLLRTHRTGATAALLRIQAAQEKFFLANNRYSTSIDGLPKDGGLGIPKTTDNGAFYEISLEPSTDTTYTVHAKPGSTSGQKSDKKCVEFTIDQNGKRAATNTGGTDNTVECWR